MKQIILTAPGRFERHEVPVPLPGPTEALIKVKAVGICGSDLHAYYGEHPFVHCPIVMGHEVAGEVAEVGAEVHNVKIGDRVVLRPQKVCGTCALCRSGRSNICKSLEVHGCQCTGASSDYYAVEAELLYQLPEGLPYDQGTVIEPLAVGVHAVKQGAADVTGKNVMVIGAGTIGNLLAQSAKGMGAKKVMITDVSDEKLDMAARCGIDCPVNVARRDLAGALQEEFGTDGPDVIYECSANAKALDQALDLARKGIPIVVVGVYSGKAEVNLANLQDREYALIGSLMYLHEDYVQAIQLVTEGKVNLEQLITNRFPLEQTAEAYQFIQAQAGKVQKVILTV